MDFPCLSVLLPCEWTSNNTVPALNDETHIWAIKLQKSPFYLNQQFGWLSNREKAKARRMLIDEKRSYQIQARAWLRWLLAAYLNTRPELINYQYGTLGKPYLAASHGQVYFNATDSGTTLLCAFSFKNEMGLDVESTPRKVNFNRIAEKKFTQKEQAAINSLQVTDRSNAFLAIWTRKEAFGKAIGLGIRYPMKQYHLCDNFESHRQKITDQNGVHWNLFQFNYQNYIACLVSRQNHEKICLYELDLNSVELE